MRALSKESIKHKGGVGYSRVEKEQVLRHLTSVNCLINGIMIESRSTQLV